MYSLSSFFCRRSFSDTQQQSIDSGTLLCFLAHSARFLLRPLSSFHHSRAPATRFCFLAGNFHGKVRKPFLCSGAVPMLYTRRNVYYRSGKHFNGDFAPLLIKASAAHADKHLSPPFFARWMCQLLRQPGSKVTL